MQVKDKQYLVKVFNSITASADTVNKKIAAYQQGKASAEAVRTTAALEQLAMQHEMLIVLAMLVFDPGTGDQKLPDFPKKVIGFS
jgi:hypothetical protein